MSSAKIPLPELEDNLVPRLPVDSDSISFQDWHISYTKSHILKSVCINDEKCEAGDSMCCDLCRYNFSLELPHLPDMVFHKNTLVLEHNNGAKIVFEPMEALKRVRNEKLDLKVSCSDEWKESRPKENTEEKVKPFDWSFSTDYSGTLNEKMKLEITDMKIDIFKLMKREAILFYQDLTLFEDELHDHGISVLSVKVRVMASGFFILLRFFLRVDHVMIRINDTRYHYEVGNKYILKEYTSREAKIEQLKNVPPALFTSPNEIAEHLPITKKVNEKIVFEE